MYKLSDNTMVRFSDTLTQVEFTKDLPEYDIKKGDLGGWVKSLDQIKGNPILISGEFRGGYFRGGYFRGGYFHGGVFHGGYFRGGYFRGGEFHGGEFHGGEFHRGVFHGGYFRGGEFHGGVFHRGVFRGGVFRGGYFHGGVFHRGVFRGGEFHGGEFHGGEFHGGEYTETPIQIFHAGYSAVVNTDGNILIGCQRHTLEEWRERGEIIANENGVESTSPYEKILDFIESMQKE